MTYLGEGYSIALFFGIAFAFTSRDRAFYLLFVFTVASTVNKNLKIIYRNPRPYMVGPEIHAFGCSKSFGNPSGHSSLSACFYTSIFLLIYHDRDYYIIKKYGS
jgi:membrane-associated phospholipid phosphatase